MDMLLCRCTIVSNRANIGGVSCTSSTTTMTSNAAAFLESLPISTYMSNATTCSLYMFLVSKSSGRDTDIEPVVVSLFMRNRPMVNSVDPYIIYVTHRLVYVDKVLFSFFNYIFSYANMVLLFIIVIFTYIFTLENQTLVCTSDKT